MGYGTQILTDPNTGKVLLTSAGGTATSPISGAVAGGAESGLFGGAGGLASGIGMGLFTNILGTTLGGLFGGSDHLWGPAAQQAKYEQMTRDVVDWVKNNPTDAANRTAIEAPSAPGFVRDDMGYFRNTNDPNDNGYYVISGNTPVKVTPPLVPVPKPSTSASGGGGGGSSGGASSGGSGGSNQPTFGAEQGNMNAPVDMDGGFVNLGIDPGLIGGGTDLNEDTTVGGGVPDGNTPGDGTGTGLPASPNGPTPMDQPPTQERNWPQIITDWLNRFPNATAAEKNAAILSSGAPINDVVRVLVGQGASTQEIADILGIPNPAATPTPTPTVVGGGGNDVINLPGSTGNPTPTVVGGGGNDVISLPGGVPGGTTIPGGGTATGPQPGDDVINLPGAGGNTGTGSGTGTDTGTGAGTGTSGGTDTGVGSGTGSGTDTGAGTGTGAGDGAGTGDGSGTGAGLPGLTGMLSPTRTTDELFRNELLKWDNAFIPLVRNTFYTGR